MSSFIMILVLAGSIAALAAVLFLAQRQFEPAEAESQAPKLSSRIGRYTPPLPPPANAAPGLVPAVSSAIEASSRLRPSNVHDAEAMSLLRAAMAKAVDGEFCAEVGRIIDGVAGVEAMHGMRVVTVGDEVLDALLIGTDVDHLVVASSGVLVVSSRVRADKVSYDGDAVFVGRGSDRLRDAMVDEIAHSMEAVADVVGPVPVRGVIVLRDLLALPDEIRSTSVEVRGIRLATVSQLAAILDEPGPVNEPALVAARLQAAFEPIFPPVEGELRLSNQS